MPSALHTKPADNWVLQDRADRQELEADLDGDETHVLPTLLAKLLFALTYNRQIK
jgi:hypothetical protein